MNPMVNPLAVARNLSKVPELFASINDRVNNYLRTEGTEAIFRLARSMILENTNTVPILRGNIRRLRDQLITIRDRSTSTTGFLTAMSDLFGGTGFFDNTLVDGSISALNFLREVKPDVEPLANPLHMQWGQQLTTSVEALEELGKDVPVGGADIRGIIVGASDINRYFAAHPDALSVPVYATNTFFDDENVDRSGRGTTIKIVSSRGKVLGRYSFTLTGIPGNAGENYANRQEFDAATGGDTMEETEMLEVMEAISSGWHMK